MQRAELPGQRPCVVMLTPDRQIDRRILLQADGLEADGWEVVIVAMALDAPAADDRRVVRIGATAKVAARDNLVLGGYRWVRSHLPMNGYWMRLLKRMAWRYLVDQEKFYVRLFHATGAQYAPRVFVAHDLPMLPVARQLAHERGARLVYDSHEFYSEQEFSAREKRRWAEIETRHIGACDAVITVNPSIARALEQRHGIPAVHVILNAERCASAPRRSRLFHERFGLEADRRLLLMQGGLSAGRNLEVLVDAMALVRDPSVALVFLGDGQLRQALEQRAAASAARGRVFFHPAVPQAELLDYTAAADAGIIPYRATCLNNYYCTPNKLFEFIAAGIPVLASDLPEIRSLVLGQGIGAVGDMGRPDQLATLIDTFFGDPERMRDWQHNLVPARKSICWEVEERKLVHIYRALR